ncbi:MAG: regulatory protein RecX [Eubacteriales bacterium]|nr:regulatory protein RecX [Eubacteriales bacterium]
MYVTLTEPVDSKKSRIYLDQEFAFILYRQEMISYHISEGAEISEEQYRKILEETILRRAKLRCLNLLKTMDRTETQLRQKLKQGEYPEEIIERAIEYVKGYRYVDDERYARQYVHCFCEKKSRYQIIQELMRRGIERETIEQALEENPDIDETEQIQKWMEKRKFDPENADVRERQRFYGFLMRRGFSAESIRKALRNAEK